MRWESGFQFFLTTMAPYSLDIPLIFICAKTTALFRQACGTSPRRITVFQLGLE